MDTRIIAAIMARAKKTNAHFGERLARLRKAAELTQTQLASKLGVSQRVITYYENESNYPPGHLLPKIAGAFGVSLEELLGDAEPVAKSTDEPPMDRRFLKRFQLLEKLPAKDQQMVFRMIDTLAAQRAKSGQSAA